jgi:hypothetical protein
VPNGVARGGHTRGACTAADPGRVPSSDRGGANFIIRGSRVRVTRGYESGLGRRERRHDGHARAHGAVSSVRPATRCDKQFYGLLGWRGFERHAHGERLRYGTSRLVDGVRCSGRVGSPAELRSRAYPNGRSHLARRSGRLPANPPGPRSPHGLDMPAIRGRSHKAPRRRLCSASKVAQRSYDPDRGTANLFGYH